MVIFILIIGSIVEKVELSLPKVITNYHHGSTALFKIFRPIICWVLKINYKTLMAVDITMRERMWQLQG
jgi:hypothetical protein